MVGPKGSVVVASKMDFRVGGTYHGAMRDPRATSCGPSSSIARSSAPERLVWEHSFSDEAGGLTRHPLSPTWPLKLLTTVTFDELLKGQTELTLRWSPLDATPEEQKTFDAAHDGMRGGWGGTFERLTAYLAAANSSLRSFRESNMATIKQKISPCLWFDTQAEDAAKFYTSVFKNSRDQTDQPLRQSWPRGARQGARLGDGRRIRDRRTDVHRAQRRPAIQIRRSGVVPGDVRRPKTRSTTSGASYPRAARKARVAG